MWVSDDYILLEMDKQKLYSDLFDTIGRKIFYINKDFIIYFLCLTNKVFVYIYVLN